MTTAATSLLGLALPVTGELAGTWGDTVNNSITSLLDSAVAGTTTLSTDGDVTLTTTTLAANQARQAILLCSGSRTALRTITAPAQSKIYTIINATTGGYSVKLVGVGPTTGVTIVAGESAVCAWNGSDFIKISNTGGSASFTNVTVSGTTTLSGLTASTALALNSSKEVVSVTNTGTGNNVLSASPTLTGTVAGASLQLSSLTATRVTYAGASGLLQDSANLTFDGTSLTLGGNPTLSAGSANGVLYLNGSKVATSGSALTFDGTNLGVGVAVPGQVIDASAANPRLKLTATSTGYAASQFVNSSGSSYFGRDNSAGGFFGIANGTVVYSSTNDPIGFYLGGSEQMRLTSTGLGIGTSSPTAKLDVFGNAKIGNGAGSNGAQLMVNNATNTATGIQLFQDGIESWIMGMPANSAALTWSASGTEQMRLTSTGLGIGTSSPAAKLDVNRGSEGEYLRAGGDDTGNNGRALRFSSSTNAGFIGALHTLNAPSAGGAIAFATTSTERMRLDSSGNLGLGVTPSANWTSAGSQKAMQIGSYAALSSSGTGAGGYYQTVLGMNCVDHTTSTKYINTGLATAYVQATGQHQWLTAPSGTAGDAITFTQAMTLDASRNLGIGTTSPAARLHVNTTAGGETFRISGGGVFTQYQAFNTTGGNYYLGVSSSTGLGLLGGASAYSLCLVTESARDIHFGTNNTLRATIDSSGNLGLGVTPSAWSGPRAFQFGAAGAVYASSNDNYFASNAYFDGTNFKRIAAAASGVFGYDGTWKWLIAGSSTADSTITFTQAMTLDASGNLGIGTTSPTQRLEVRTAADKITQFLSGSGAAVQWQTLNDAKTANVPLAISTSETYFLTGGSERARIDSSGNLLVGTTSAISAGKYSSSFAGATENGIILQTTLASTGSTFIGFVNSSGSIIGSVTQNGASTVAYNTSSDYRLKNVIGNVTGSGARIDALEPIEYEWKASGERTRGFLAHKFQEVYPQSVTGTKDAVDADGNPVYQAMQASTSEVIADLVAELQSLRKRLADAGIA